MNKKTKITKQKTPSKMGNDNQNEGSVKVLGDHIYFYTGITPDSAVDLNKVLQDLSMKLAPSAFSSMHEIGQPSPIWLHINSMGGDVFSSFAIADTIERISQVVPVVTIVEGCAASGATFISTAGSKRLMRKSAYMLIHEISDLSWGRHSEMEDNLTSNREIMVTVKDWYKQRTKIPAKKLDDILVHDIWWNAKKCLKYGLIDAII
jgi:ATP-dependent Clp protease protease subunit